MKDIIIYYFDDDQEDLFALQSVIHQMAQTVKLFGFADEALISMENQPIPTLVFIDLNMRGKSGFEILRDLKANDIYKEVPIVVLSNADNEMVINKAYAYAASLYVVKPGTREELGFCLKELLSIDWSKFTRTRQKFVVSHC